MTRIVRIFENFFTPVKKFLNVIKKTKAHVYYNLASLKNRYPCKMVGGKHIFESKDTIVIYTILNKKERHEVPIRDLLNDPLLLERFHPSQAVKFGFIAFGDILLGFPEKKQMEKYKEIMEKMLAYDKSE